MPENLTPVPARRARLTGHSTAIANAVLLGYAKLSDGAKLTYMVLESYDWPDKDGYSKGKCWPSIETIAAARGKSYDTIARHLKELETAGLIRVESGQERGVANCYWLLGPSQEEFAAYLSRFSETAGEDENAIEEGEPHDYGSPSLKHAEPAPAFLPEEKHESQESKPKIELDSNPARSTGKAEPRDNPRSGYIAQIALDFSRTLNDLPHSLSNQTQAQNLYRQSGLDERAFVELLYEAKKRTQWAAMATPKTVGNGPNRAAYFFKVVRDLLETKTPGKVPAG